MQIIHENINNTVDGNPSVGVDSEESELTEEAATYPVSDDDRIGVNTDKGQNPESMDQADEEYDAKVWGTPDDPAPNSVYPLPTEEQKVSGHEIG